MDLLKVKRLLSDRQIWVGKIGLPGFGRMQMNKDPSEIALRSFFGTESETCILELQFRFCALRRSLFSF